MSIKNDSPLRRARLLPAILIAVIASASILLAACGGSSSTSGGSGESGESGETSENASSGSPARIYAGIGTPSSEYWSAFNEGAEAIADSTGSEFQALASEFSGQKALENFSTVFARGCEDCAAALDPAESAVTEPIVKNAVKGGAWIVTLWNKPDDFHPWEESEHWVAHTTFSGLESGEKNAEALIEAMGGEGNIVALRGIPDNPPAIERRQGLINVVAKNPGVKILEEQIGDWETTKGQEITETWLSKYGDEIDGIFSANDGMALGAVEALRAKGLNGKIPVTGSDGETPVLEAIKNGDMVSTMYINGAVQAAYSEAIAYAAEQGEIDPNELSHEQREYYMEQTLVTKDNVDEILAEEFNPSEYTYDKLKGDLWGNSTGPIVYGNE